MAAKELGYRMDSEVSRYMRYLATREGRRQKGVLGFLHLADNEREKEISRYAEKRAHELGYDIYSVRVSEHANNPSRISKIFAARGIKAFVIGNATRQVRSIELDWEKFAVVEMGHTLSRVAINRVIGNHFKNTQLGLRKLRLYGYQRIGFVCPSNVCQLHANMSYSAYLFQMQEISADNRIPPLIPKPPFQREALARWVRKHKPDAILTTSPFTYQYLQELGMRIPDDIGIIEYRDFERADGEIAAVVENREIKVTTSIDFLIGMEQRFETGLPKFPVVMMIDGRWQNGKSIQKRPR